MTTHYPVLHHPGTGETIRVLESTTEVFRMELTIAPFGEVAGAHIHPNQEQIFEVTSGRLACRVDGKERILAPGEVLVLPPGKAHTQGNPFAEPVVAIETYRPSKRIHEFFQAFFALGQRGLTDKKGAPTPLYAAALLDEYKDSITIGALFDRVLLRLLAPLARALGYHERIRTMVQGQAPMPRGADAVLSLR